MGTATKRRFTRLTMAVPSDEPPDSFRIFQSGPNETTKGTFIFDAAAAKSVMAEYTAHGIDLTIDYDHAMLGGGVDPAQSGKAAGWFELEVRAGELWAVNVRWTEAAATALRAKEWRFMSPAFATKEGRVTQLVNVALTNLPATRRLTPLVAASETVMDASMVQEALDALIADDTEKCAELLKSIIAAAASGEAAPKKPAPEPSVTAEKPGAKPPVPPPDEDIAATAKLMRLTATTTTAAALAHVETLMREMQATAAERDELVIAERRRLCTRLVVAAGAAPASVWSSPDPGAPPKAYLDRMTLTELREHVENAIRTSGGRVTKTSAISPPVGGDVPNGGKEVMTPEGPVTLKARELALCAANEIDVTAYALLALRTQRAREAREQVTR